jgi:hypothetical protein
VPNGSFEGSLSYWIPRNTPVELIQGDAPHGSWFLRRTADKGFIHSAPLLIEPGTTITVAMWARCEKGSGTMALTVHPTPRQAGMPPWAIGRGSSGGGKNPRPWNNPTLTTEWQRVSITMTMPDYRKEKQEFPAPWWWSYNTWWLFFEAKNVGHIDIDGVTIVTGEQDPGFVPYTSIETAVHLTDLPPYNPTGALLNQGDTVTALAALHNPGTEARTATLRWTLRDYAGDKIFDQAEQSITLAAGGTELIEHKQVLTAKGTLLVTAQIIDPQGNELGRSHAPATTMPNPFAATEPDPRERFGGTLVAGDNLNSHHVDIGQQMGMRWTRWYPHMNWKDFQPKGPDDWQSERTDAILADLRQHGFSVNVVLYARPDWAFSKDDKIHTLPSDMQWTADDPRWNDLSVETHWDRYVKRMLTTYAGPSFAWEIINEPQFDRWPSNELHFLFVKRTAALIKSIDPAVKVMINSVNGFDGISKDFSRRGGGEFIDVFTWHNYSPNGAGSAETIRQMELAFRRADGTGPENWFNEGWTWFPSSRASVTNGMIATRSPEQVAHMVVRNQAELATAGMDKMILFNMAYQRHGRSWWDWAGDGTELWDDHNEPTIAVPVFNVLAKHIGLAQSLSAIRHQDAWIHTFHDLRNNRGVAIIWGTTDGELLLPVSGLQAEDVMGNADPIAHPADGSLLPLRENRPVYVFKDGLSGAELDAALAPLQRAAMAGGDGEYTIPRDWMEREAKGNPYVHNDKPLWAFGRIYPPDRADADAYIVQRQFVPTRNHWSDIEHTQGGFPSGKVDQEGHVSIAAGAPWGGAQKDKPACLLFYAPTAGTYRIEASAFMNRWEGKGAGHLRLVLLNSEQGEVQELAHWDLPQRKPVAITAEAIELRANQRLALVYHLDGMFSAGSVRFDGLRIERK